MEVADYIYGTTMAEPNITSIYSVKIKDKSRNALPKPDAETQS
jgi:chromosome segregation ATPase